jgi:hypothetical protein
LTGHEGNFMAEVVFAEQSFQRSAFANLLAKVAAQV